MRVVVIVSVLLAGLIALAGCAPSYYSADYGPGGYAGGYGSSRGYYGSSRGYDDTETFQYAPRVHPRRRYRKSRRGVKRSRRPARRYAARAPTAPPPQPEQKPSNARSDDVAAAPDADRADDAAREMSQPAPPVEQAEPQGVPVREAETPKSDAVERPERIAGTPQRAEPFASPAPPEVTEAMASAKQQIEDGYRLLRAGFVKKARERFDRAMDANAAEASLAQGRSMDPTYLKTVAFPDVIPDPEQARRLYRRSVLLGNREAKTDLQRLERAMAAAEPALLAPTSPANAAPAQ